MRCARFVTQPSFIHQIFNKHFEHIEEIVDNDVTYNQELQAEKIARDYHLLRNVRLQNFKPQAPVEYAGERAELLETTSYDSTFEEEAIQKKRDNMLLEDKASGKGLLKLFGYKHMKSMRFFAQLLRCLRDAYEGKYEQLNANMNFFILLKNEL